MRDGKVRRVRPVSISHPDHFVNVARRRALEEPDAVFADQFENLANYHAHLDTGVDAHVCAVSTHIRTSPQTIEIDLPDM